MTQFRKLALSVAAIAVLAVAGEARDQIKIVGSSTVYPFSSYVAEEFGATTGNKTPVVESTGSGGGMKLFCAGDGLDTPDITNASRPMKSSELETCEKNGVTDITGAVIGYDGIAFAQAKSNGHINLTREQMFLALAAEVPVDGKLVKNPYKKWSEIDKTLPNRDIIVYGPPTTSGTRDAFNELVMEHASKGMKEYGDAAGKYKELRQDGVYVPSGENDNLIVQKLEQNKAGFGIFGYSFLEENADKVIGAKIEGFEATPENIASAKYPISRSLFFYVKNSHRKDVKGMDEYVSLFMDDKMIGDKGVLKTIGLIPLANDVRVAAQKSVLAKTKLTADMVKNHTVLK